MHKSKSKSVCLRFFCVRVFRAAGSDDDKKLDNSSTLQEMNDDKYSSGLRQCDKHIRLFAYDWQYSFVRGRLVLDTHTQHQRTVDDFYSSGVVL